MFLWTCEVGIWLYFKILTLVYFLGLCIFNSAYEENINYVIMKAFNIYIVNIFISPGYFVGMHSNCPFPYKAVYFYCYNSKSYIIIFHHIQNGMT